MKIYLAVWNGGYDLPSYTAHKTQSNAVTLARKWAEMAEDGDQIDVLEIDTETLLIEVVA